MKPLDAIDHKILNILQEDSTISIKELAEKVGLSFTPTYERIKSMKQSGVIAKYVAIVDREKIGFGIVAYCNVILKEQSSKNLLEFEERIKNAPEILEIISLSGTYDYMLKIVARTIKEYNDFMVNFISSLPGIGQYHSHIVLSTIKEETKITL